MESEASSRGGALGCIGVRSHVSEVRECLQNLKEVGIEWLTLDVFYWSQPTVG